MKLSEAMDDLSGRFLMYLPPSEVNNTERLFFQVEEAHWFYEDYYRKKYNLPYLNLREFTLHLMTHSEFAKNLAGVDEGFKKFLKYKKTVPVFGALIFNTYMNKILLVRGFGPKGSFTFPRGKVCKSENGVECAIREVYEEVGYNIREKMLYKMYVETGTKTKESKLFAVLNVSEKTTQFQTKTRNEIKEIRWVSIEAIEKQNIQAYLYVKTHLKEIKDLVQRIEQDKPKLDMVRLRKAFSLE